MNEKFDGLSIFGAAIVVSLFACIWITYQCGWGWFPVIKEVDLSAWVQAIGSIGAIWFSLQAVQKQHRLERRRAVEGELSARIALYNGAFQIVGAVYQVALKIQAMGQRRATGADLERARIELEGLANALARVDMLRFDEHQVIQGI